MPIFEATLILRGFAVQASIGIHDFERAAPQRLLIDIELTLDDAAPPDADVIGHVLDYDFLRQETTALLARRHYDLQETLCHDIAAFCLARPQVRAVMVYSRKPDVYPDCESVGYRLHMSR
ncbi:dihydroneopterin aldolase [Acidocella sp.]|uniref:dihydroneopterin aldolase n=1 Tax=Acidocella sp. TaxID=50710 RepID=UPI002634DD09|nr:dihydroneopterin aldolase [Acidocella sp.]